MAKTLSITDVCSALQSSIRWHTEQGRPHSASVDRDAAAVIGRLRVALSRIRDAAHWQSNSGDSSNHCDVLETIEREARAALADGDA